MNNHIHKYIRKDIGQKILNGKRASYIVYSCSLANCNHYITEKLVQGKSSLCWNCEQMHQIKPRNGRINKKNVCDDCYNRKNKKVVLDDVNIEKLLKSSKII